MRNIQSYDDFVGEGEPEYEVELVDIDLIKPGDTVVIDGDLKTVSKKDITTGGGMGTRLFGDSYGLGTKKVQRVVFGHSASGKK
jgi:hypothetical protein